MPPMFLNWPTEWVGDINYDKEESRGMRLKFIGH